MKSKWASALVAVLAVSSLSIGLARAAQASDEVTLGPIVRNADGSVLRMFQHEALSYCATRGGLPTAKQLALAFNPGGVSDTARDGFRQIAPMYETPFYYTSRDYERPTAGDEEAQWFWSSSINHNYDDLRFAFGGHVGYFDYGGRYSRIAVRCASR